MTNYEKLYEMVGIKPIMLADCEFRNLYLYGISYGNDVCELAKKEYTHYTCENGCKHAKCHIPYYPDFTAEKQIELIKKMFRNQCDFQYCYYENKYGFVMNDDFEIEHADFSEALAGLALQLVEAGELDKEEVKEILQ